MKKFLTAVLAATMFLGLMGFTVFAEETISVWDGTTIDTSWYDTTNTSFTIDTAAKLAGLAAIVNGTAADITKDTFSGKTISLTADIDLNNKEWTPIGNSENNFKGSFDGGEKTIKNLTVNGSNDYDNKTGTHYVGLFGYLNNAGSIKNLTINNADVSGCLYVGSLVGRFYIGDAIENCHITGNIFVDGYWYIGGLVGRYEYADGIRNCSVIGNENSTSYIKADITDNKDKDGSYVGGIVGFMAEGNFDITNCSVKNLDISGATRIGGVTGLAHYQNTIANNSVENVSVSANYENSDGTQTKLAGLIAGANQGGQNDGSTPLPSYVINNTVAENCSATSGGESVTTHSGSTISGTTPKSTVVGTDVVLDKNKNVISGTLEAVSDTSLIAENSDMLQNKDGTYSVGKVPTGKLTYGGYVSSPISDSNDREKIQVDVYDATAYESFVVEIWCGETKLATTTLRSTDRDDSTPIALPNHSAITANIVVSGRLAGSWDTEWHKEPSSLYVPDTFKVIADGVEIAVWNTGMSEENQLKYKSLTAVSEWEENTDSGRYDDGDTTYGMIRFLFKSDLPDEVTVDTFGIKYVKGNDIAADVAKQSTVTAGETGNQKVFYGDLIGIKENAEDTYYAIAYVTVGKTTYWSDIISYTPDWTKKFTNYEPKTVGGAE